MPGKVCSACKKNELATDDQIAMQACDECAELLGLMRIPPARRPARPCGRCNGLQFMRVIPREHTMKQLGERVVPHIGPMYATHAIEAHERMRDWLLEVFTGPREPPGPGETPRPIDVRSGVGLLEMYICTRCGLVEWYCHDVERIQAHPALMTELVDYESDKPYR